MLGWIFAAMLNAVRGTARLFSYEIQIVLTEHKIKTKFAKPNKLEEKDWDSNHWVYGNIFVKGVANPVKITKSKLKDEDHEIITSERYKSFMEQSLINDMLQASKSDGLTLKQALIVILATNTLTIGIIYILSGGGI